MQTETPSNQAFAAIHSDASITAVGTRTRAEGKRDGRFGTAWGYRPCVRPVSGYLA